MPSARIMTRAVEDALPLAQDLRTRGFVVQIVSPGQASTDPVDLEVTLEECEPEAALRQADATPEADDLHVFVAPGALTDGPRPIKVVPLIPEMQLSVVARVEPQKAAEPELLEEVAKLEESGLEEPAIVSPAAGAPVPPVMAEIAQPVTLATTAPEKAKPQEIPILSPEVWGARVLEPVPVAAHPRKRLFYREAAQQLDVWLAHAGANDKMLLRAAMGVAICAVVALSMLVLGAMSRPLPPMPTQVESASEAPEPPARVVPVAGKPHLQADVAPVRVSTPKRPGHNPEEDVVAKDFVIRYSQRPASLSAKKSSGVKHYSDLR